MTLPELLVSIMVVGLIVVAITAAISVTLRVEPSVSGRLNVARFEQNIATWMPGDLSSAATSDEDPMASPCGGCADVAALGGSNALMVSWPDGGSTTTVSYVYRPASDDETYDLVRAECTGATCNMVTVLRDLEGPPHGEFVPGVTGVPHSVFNVSVPLRADAQDEDEANQEAAATSAQRITVQVNGGGTADGAGGGINRISITAGGTSLDTLAAAQVTGPGFLAARSRCGGPITLIVDESGSIKDDVDDVRTAVSEFVDALSGTPTSVQVIRFDTISDVMSPDASDWNHYYEMSDEAQVASLQGEVSGIRGDWGTYTSDNTRGGTNWEDALYRTFYAEDGKPLNNDGNPVTVLPNLVVFFTDGAPTFDRTNYTSDGASVPADPAEPDFSVWPESNGYQFGQVAWDRAEFIASDFRSTVPIVGVGVGGISNTSFSFTDPGAGIRYSSSYVESKQGNSWKRIGNGRTTTSTGSGWPTTAFNDGLVSNSKLLGNLIVGGVPTNIDDDSWVESNLVDGEWTNLDEADMLISDDFDALPSALTSIALGQCGGSLTLQTEFPDGSPVPSDFTYETGGKTVTTSRLSRAAAFDLDIPGGGTLDATVTPQAFDPTYAATGWSCSKKGTVMTSGWSLVTPGVPSDGVTVTVGANEAVSCTMTVM